MTAHALAGAFDLAAYNSLMTVEAADAAVRKDGALGGMLDAYARVIGAHGMQDRFGIALLHRHNRCADGERMVEYREAFRDTEALVTRPVGRSAAADAATPAVWALQGDAFAPLEYTTDPEASGLLMREPVPDSFLQAFRAVAGSLPMAKLLGLAVVSRAFYARARDGEIVLEYSNLLPRANVVLMSDPEVAAGKAIETAWRVQTRIDAMSKCVDPRECLKRCHQSDGSHSGRQVHVPGPGEHIPG